MKCINIMAIKESHKHVNFMQISQCIGIITASDGTTIYEIHLSDSGAIVLQAGMYIMFPVPQNISIDYIDIWQNYPSPGTAHLIFLCGGQNENYSYSGGNIGRSSITLPATSTKG